MAQQFPELGAAYIGPNGAHLRFRTTLANAKALGFLLGERDPSVLKRLFDQAEAAKEASPDGTYSIGRIGRADETSAQLAVLLTSNEVHLVGEAGGFEEQLFGLVYREAYRGLETYLVDLFEEVATADPRVLYSDRKISHEEALRAAKDDALVHVIVQKRIGELTRLGFDGLAKLFDSLNLHFFAPRQGASAEEIADVERRLRLGAAARNILEHNSGIVNAEFLSLVRDSGLTLGQRFVVGFPELGDLLSAAEWVTDHLNQRAVAKFALGGADSVSGS